MNFRIVLCISLAAICLLAQRTSSAAVRNRDRSRRHQRGRIVDKATKFEEETPYFWMCPEVQCPAISPTCNIIENFVFQYDYEIRGKVVTVRCESCDYCMDGPYRRKRSLREIFSVESLDCPPITCPELPDSCTDVRLTDILVKNTVCKRCMACYDNTVIGNTSH